MKTELPFFIPRKNKEVYDVFGILFKILSFESFIPVNEKDIIIKEHNSTSKVPRLERNFFGFVLNKGQTFFGI
jgi:hypothetical protein